MTRKNLRVAALVTLVNLMSIIPPAYSAVCGHDDNALIQITMPMFSGPCSPGWDIYDKKEADELQKYISMNYPVEKWECAWMGGYTISPVNYDMPHMRVCKGIIEESSGGKTHLAKDEKGLEKYLDEQAEEKAKFLDVKGQPKYHAPLFK